MLNIAEKFKRIPQTRYLGPARVLESDVDGGQICLHLTGHPNAGSIWARNAVAGQHVLQPGETVLVIGEDLDELYVIGVLNRNDNKDASDNSITLSKGAQARTEGLPGEQSLKVFSPNKDLIFQYDENSGNARVNMEAGDIEFVTEKGSITFAANKEIMFHGRSIGMTGAKGICLGVMDTLGRLCSNLTIQKKTMKIESPEMGIEVERGEFHVEEAKHKGKKLISKVERLETIAESVITKAKNAYQTIDELSQVRAGRMRTMISKTFHFKSKKAFVKAEEDYKINAEKIHLG